jgi:hypothetical protein
MFNKLSIIILFIVFTDLSASDFGTIGIIDIPSARMLDDGTLKATLSFQKIANITNITYQATPWLQTTFRYTIFNPDNPIRNSKDVDGLNDRSYSVKLRMAKEGKYKPQIAIGLKDILGTGAWGSEFIVASKKMNNFDISMGFGWGRLSENNRIKNPFNGKDISHIGGNYGGGGEYGGKLRSNSFFKGEYIGIFGGIDYKISNSNFSFLAEYNSDSYKREIIAKTISDSSPLSYGIKWKGADSFNIALTYQQGNQVGFLLSSKINTKKSSFRPKNDIFYSSYDGYQLSGAPKSLNLNSWYDRLFYDMDRSGLLLRTAKIAPENSQVTIEISNFRYNLVADAIQKALTLSQIHVPRDIKNINIIINENGHRVAMIAFDQNNYSPRNQVDRIKLLEGRKITNPTDFTKISTPRIGFDVNLSSKFQLFDPDNPAKYQVYLKTGAVVSLPKNWNIFGSFALDIYNDFDLNNMGPQSALPNVRTDINRYLVEGSTGIDSLYLEKKSTINKNLHYRAYIGILESMYSGVGGEILYQPIRSRFALGGTMSMVKKRGYKRNFELLDYKVMTGFVSMYYASPFYNYDLALHLGRYLAKDRGATIEIRRTFDNGFSVGAFATLTNVSATDFGEGSFDKGLYFKIPLNALTKNNTKTSYSTILRSIQRDGGQKLDDFSGRLWHDLRNVRYDNLSNNKQRMLPK